MGNTKTKRAVTSSDHINKYKKVNNVTTKRYFISRECFNLFFRLPNPPELNTFCGFLGTLFASDVEFVYTGIPLTAATRLRHRAHARELLPGYVFHQWLLLKQLSLCLNYFNK